MTWKGGQAIQEYALLLAVATMAIVGMQLYAKRAIQAAVKTGADRLSPYAEEGDAGYDANGELAQAHGMRLETGDQTHKFRLLGRVLANTSSVLTEQEPSTATTSQTETGEVTRSSRSVIRTSGKLGSGGRVSFSEVVADDQP